MTLFASDLYFPSLLVLWLAVAVDALWRWPQSTHPLTFMRYLIRQMGQKVLPSDNYAAGQHYISGALAAIVLLSPLVVCLAVLVYMAEYPVFFEAVIMVSLLDFGFQRQQYKKVMACVGRNKKSLAREMVKTITARQCHALTDIGIAKAAIESLYLKFLYLYCGVIFYFVVFGPITALVYRLLLLTSWQWHYREKGMHHFALPVRKLVSVLVLPPAIFGAFATLVVTNPVKGIAAMRKARQKDKTSLLLALLGGALNIKLGGPAMYADKKYRHARVGGVNDVKYSSMHHTRQTVHFAMAVVCAVASLVLLAKGVL
ncbi:cobalamin biosynthesis family protein [Alteromonas sp. MTD1]|uniref:cobalamin biosynthesis protein n=1 Tax=Alteromonas sp. MTD1 TaxID=3057962 RepID=UPI0036F20286